jgi:transposase
MLREERVGTKDHAALERFDEHMRTQPTAVGEYESALNVALARAWMNAGHPDKAIEAARRRIFFDPSAELLHSSLLELLAEIEALEQRCQQIDRELARLNEHDPVVERLLKIPGVGPLTATALRASVVDVQRFPSARHFASWLGLTSREHSSGERRRLGRISKQGDPYLRTLLIHGARAVLLAARSAQRRGSSLDRLRTWALDLQQRRGHNKAAVALANKLARIVWATWRYERDFASRL